MSITRAFGCLAVVALLAAATVAAEPAIEIKQEKGKLVITRGGEPVATYMHKNKETPRPFFMALHAPGGVQVSRNNPPVKGQDLDDHNAYHPGLFFACGDISKNDYWRTRAKVKHVEYTEKPTGGPGKGSFAVKSNYMSGKGGKVVCTEVCKYTFLVRPQGTLILWESTFSSDDADFVFGDQEEMGLAIRVNTPMNVKHGKHGRKLKTKATGKMVNSKGNVNEKGKNGCWGKQAEWCDYSGTVGGKYAGVTLMPHPGNFNQPWFHAREYGVLVANPFSPQAFAPRGKRVKPGKLVVKKGEKLQLRWGILLHSGEKEGDVDLKAAYADYVSVAGK